MDTNNAFSQSLLGSKREASPTHEAHLPVKKKPSSSSSEHLFISGTFCCQPPKTTSFLNIKVSHITDTFSIGKELGSGSEGTVSLSTCHRHNQQFAIKRIGANTGASNEILTCLKTINNIHIIIFYAEYFVENREPASDPRYLIFEYLEGFNLEKAFNCRNLNKMTEDNIHYILNQLFEINRALTQYKILHRDLRFSNIMYCVKTKTLKAIDFGKSMFWDPSTQSISIARQNVILFFKFVCKISVGLTYTIPKEISNELQGKGTDIQQQLVRWVESESNTFQNFVENPLLAQKELKFCLNNTEEHELRRHQNNQQLKRLLNKAVTEIMIWGTILYLILQEDKRFKPYLNHFTLEKFFHLQQNLLPSNDKNLDDFYHLISAK